MRELATGLALCAALNVGSHRAWPSPSRGLPTRLSPDAAVETAGLLSFGMRRLAADIGLARLLIYYGTLDNAGHRHDEPGDYPEIGPRARRILELDPSFSYPALYAAGALAFNLGRTEEALDLLTQAMSQDPGNDEYRAYIAAIGFHRDGDVKRVIELLEPAVEDTQCPTMIKNILAFLYRRTGQKEKATRLYRDIAETSRDAGYRQTARRNLRELSGH